MEANASTWNKLLSIYINKSNKKALKYLACSENPEIIINFLNISIANNSIIQDKDIAYSSIIRKHATNNVIINYILTNLKQIISRYVNNIFYINCKHNIFCVYLLYKFLNFKFFAENTIWMMH